MSLTFPFNFPPPNTFLTLLELQQPPIHQITLLSHLNSAQIYLVNFLWNRRAVWKLEKDSRAHFPSLPPLAHVTAHSLPLFLALLAQPLFPLHARTSVKPNSLLFPLPFPLGLPSAKAHAPSSPSLPFPFLFLDRHCPLSPIAKQQPAYPFPSLLSLTRGT
jgi:hypothetical protein